MVSSVLFQFCYESFISSVSISKGLLDAFSIISSNAYPVWRVNLVILNDILSLKSSMVESSFAEKLYSVSTFHVL